MSEQLNRDNLPIITQSEKFPEYQIKTLCYDPPIVTVDSLLTADECQHLIDLGKDSLKASTMVWGNKQFVDVGRSSRTANLISSGETNPKDPVINKLLTQLSQLSGYPLSHFEALQLLNYQTGQYYVAHHDYFSDSQPNFIKHNGDRCLTFFIYLNTLEPKHGGSTYFPDLKLDVQPKQGMAVFWVNMDNNGNYLTKTKHGGSQVFGNAEKWALNLWIRERPY